MAPSSIELEKTYKDVLRRIDGAHTRFRQTNDLRRRPISYSVRDKVYRKNYVLSDATKHFTAELAPKYIGSFEIKHKLSPVTYELMDTRNKNKDTWHIKDLKSHPTDSSAQSDSN
ncbi:hypothetical protein NQ314_009816 [Rhamnusium bicolor]|uniref:Uncharacterized protein n=1 Tax=Rhamnusium bicolor TaxID=1586634 RepID=A0AAV8XZ84_9CUCU|nr:hypothetical protein NQ314_009816 [Rhamnusium bicolor]